MEYFSTQRNSPSVSFREALLSGQPPDKGVYFPSQIPRLSADLLNNLQTLANAEIAFEIIRPYIAGEIPDDEVFAICSQSVDFPFPLVPINERISVLELFHGPTLAFKDVGARFMSRCLQSFTRQESRKTVVLVATSGDTGGAVAHGFHDLEGIEVVIMYPKGRVSGIQELQLTTLGNNVTTLEVRGSFDDCQSLAKQALTDPYLQKRGFLTSANSINIARWLPQQFYYAFALKAWDAEPPVFSVPSGNFGNVAAGLLLFASGLPVRSFIAACNSNDTIPRFMETRRLDPRPTISTLSNAMDVSRPSNFDRVLEIFDGDFSRLSTALTARTVDDGQTAEAIRQVYQRYGYVMDPHGAVGYRALSDFLSPKPEHDGIFLQTAHPAKFESVEEIIGNYGVAPDSLTELSRREKQSIETDVDYSQLREIVAARF